MIRILLLLGLLAAACDAESLRREEGRAVIERVEQALQEGKLAAAERELRTLLSQEDRLLSAYQTFLAGQLSWQQAEVKLAQAQAAFGKAEDWREAVRGMRRAEVQWRAASRTRSLHPVACRNVERAQRRLAEVLELAEQAGIELGDAAQDTAQQEAPDPPQSEQQQAPAIPPPPTPERIDALLERMQQQEERKQSERAALPGLDLPEVERDW